MTEQWFQTTDPEVIERLFVDLIAEASEEEHVSILFNLLQSCLDMAARGAETGQGILQRNGVIGAVTILSFLRHHLRANSRNPANGVLRRFYNAAHRQIVTAHRDNVGAHLRDVRTSIAKVIQKPYSTSFFHNCLQETSWTRKDLLRLILCAQVRACICRVDSPILMFAGERSGKHG